MTPFNLEEYLENTNRKVVTRRGNPVRIICTDRKHGEDDLPIVFLEENNEGEFLLACKRDGRSGNYDTQYDLFFADEEEKKHELTEFERTMIQFSHERDSLIQFEHTTDEVNAHLYLYSEKLLDLARKEILKDLPKWKKCVGSTGPFLDYNSKGEEYLYLNDYVIKVSKLFETLPKEE